MHVSREPMTQEPVQIRPCSNPTAAKAAYSRAARKKLVDSRAKLETVTATVKQAIATGRLPLSEQMDRDIQVIETVLNTAEERLRSLQKSGRDDWERRRIELESAWEELARSTKNLVARFADGARNEKDKR